MSNIISGGQITGTQSLLKLSEDNELYESPTAIFLGVILFQNKSQFECHFDWVSI